MGVVAIFLGLAAVTLWALSRVEPQQQKLNRPVKAGASPVTFDSWQRLSRAVPTYATTASQHYGAEWELLTRRLELARVVRPTPRWALTVFSGNRRMREWLIPAEFDAGQAQREAQRIINGWGISDADTDVDTDVGGSLEIPGGGFAWHKLQNIVKSMWQNATTSDAAIRVLNKQFPGRGNELALAMSLIHRAAQNDYSALLEISAVRDAVARGETKLASTLELYKMVNAARKAAFGPEPKKKQPATGDDLYEALPLPKTESTPYQMLPR